MKLWLVVTALAMALHLGSPPLIDNDEGRNAEVAREMAATNDYVMPRYNTLPYLDKPIVYFAAEAAAMEVLGPTELAARLPAYLFTVATAAVVFAFARRIGADPFVASIVFLAMPMTIAFARIAIFDSALTFFSVAALVAFYVAIEERSKRWSIAAWAAMGLAMLTKGPVTFILVLFVAIPFAWRRRAVGVLFPIVGLAVFAAIIVPWVWGVSQVVPEFLNYVLVTETAARMATDELQRTGPPWYFVPFLIVGAVPWSIVALASWRQLKQRDDAILYLLLWIAIPFVFFSISQSKRPQYILPLMPALALLVAKVWHDAKTRAAAIALGVLGAVLLSGPLLMPRFKMKPEIAGVAPETSVALGIALLLGAALALVAKRRELVLIALSLPMIALPLLTNPLMRALGERRSAKTFVTQLRPHVTPQTEIIGVEAFTGSIVFYLRRPITLITEDASELTSNYILRRYARYVSDPRSPLKPLGWLEPELARCCRPRIWIVRIGDHARRARLESRGMRVVARGAHVVAYR